MAFRTSPIPNEVDVPQTLTLTNISIDSTPATLPIDGTPAPMYLITVDNAAVTLDTVGGGMQKTIWLKNTTATDSMLIAADGQTIDGEAIWVLPSGFSVQLWADGIGAWWVIAASDAPWGVLIQTPANTGGGVLIRDDWDTLYGPGWIGLVPLPVGDSLLPTAGLMIHGNGYVSGEPPQGAKGNYVATFYNKGQNIQDQSGLSGGQWILQMAESAGLFGPNLTLGADDDVGFEAIVIEQGFQETLRGVWQVDYDGNVQTHGDETFETNAVGPVLTDQEDGHTYRIISTAGILSTQMVT